MADRARSAGLHAFVGRKLELDTLRSALDASERGAGGVHLLRGEAGIGKSRTAHEIADAARERGFEVRIGHCLDAETRPAYRPFTRALEDSAAGRVLAARRDAHAPGDDDGDLDPKGERDQLFRGVEQALREAAAVRPQLLLLEDLHWADLDSLRLLQHLAQRLHDCAWLALCTQRDETPSDARLARRLGGLARNASTVPLGPLAEAEVEALVTHWSGRRPAAELLQAACRRSGGNPLFLCELLALVLATEGQVSLDALDAAGIPTVLAQLIERRLEPLGEETLALLSRAAVLGDPFELSELASWLSEKPETLLVAIEPAEQMRLVSPARGPRSARVEPAGELARRFRFSHALVRDALLARMSRAERAALHHEVAAMLEAAGRDRSESQLARLADHHRHTFSADSAQRAVECAAEAAALAIRQGAPDQAVQHLQLALDSLAALDATEEQRSRRRCGLLLELGEARTQTGEREGAFEAFLEAARISQQSTLHESLARAAIGMVGRDEDPRGLAEEIHRWVELACEKLDTGSTPLRARLLALASRLAGERDQAQRSETLAREALAIAEQVGKPELWASTAHALHTTMIRPDALGKRLELSQQMVEAAERGPSRRTELRARQRRLTDLLQSGEAAAAEQELARIESLARENDQPAFHWHALTLAAGRDLWRGRLESAEQRLAEALEQGRRAGLRNAGALFSVQMFHLRDQQGRLGELRPGMQELVEKTPQVRSLPLIIPLATMQEGDALMTRTTFEPLAARNFEDVPFDRDWLAVMTTTARIAAYLRDRERCDLLLQKLQPYEDWCVVLPDGQYWEGSVARHLAGLEAVLGKVEQARAHFRVAVECARRAGALPLLAHTLHELGSFEAENPGPEEAAAEALGESAALFRSLELPLFLERVEAALAALDSRSHAASEQESAPLRRAGRFEREGGHWTVEFAGRRALVEHRKGMSDLAVLLASPGREIHVLDLMRSPAVGAAARAPTQDEAAAGTGPASLPGIDPAALGEYRERLAELRSEREQADARGDLGARRAADTEIEWIERELRDAFGAERGTASDFSQKARKAIYNRIRAATSAIADAHPDLGRHLRNSIRTGVVCVYQPESREEWLVDEGAPR